MTNAILAVMSSGMWQLRSAMELGHQPDAADQRCPTGVSFRQACMNPFEGCGIVGCRDGTSWRTADGYRQDTRHSFRIGKRAAAIRVLAKDTSNAFPIPDSLWAAAVTAAGRYGICQTSRVLRLHYYTLKDRVEQRSAATNDPAEGTAAAPFLEPAPSVAHGFSTAPVGHCECTVELEASDGAKMRIHLKGAQTPDLAALSRSFWNPVP